MHICGGQPQHLYLTRVSSLGSKWCWSFVTQLRPPLSEWARANTEQRTAVVRSAQLCRLVQTAGMI